MVDLIGPMSRNLTVSRSELTRARHRSVIAADVRAAGRGMRGFTLIEILVVVVIIAILATLVAPNVFQHVGSARETTARTQIEMLGAALDAFQLHVGRYPTSQEGLAALWERPASAPSTWRGPYLRRAVPVDPWGHAYVYEGPGSPGEMTYRVTSLGADGKRGGDGEAGDISAH